MLFRSPKSISEAYHKAKADGSNPELVKAVEELLGKPTEQPKETIPNVESKKADIERRRQEEISINGLATDLRGIISSRLIKEGISQEERNKLIGTQTNPIISSANRDDINNLIHLIIQRIRQFQKAKA